MQVTLFGLSTRVPYSLILFVGSLILSLIATRVIMAFSRRAGLLDRPGPRRIHTEATPTLGGLAIAFAILVAAWGAHLLPGPVRDIDPRPLIGFTMASLPILALVVVDDLRGVRPIAKLLVQTIAAVILYAFGLGIPVISLPLGAEVASGLWNLPLTIIWVLLVTNAINLVDGIDGLAAGAVFIASMTLWWVGRDHLDIYVMFLTAVMAGACLGFLRYNFPPAKIFMGDTGSQFLGLTLAAVSLIDNRKGTTTITLLFPLVAMGIPVFDGVLAFIRRVSTGRPVFTGDAEHLHHRLLRLGLSKRKALLVLWYLCGYLGVMAVVLSALPRDYSWFVLALLVMGLYLAFEVLEFVDRRISRDP